MSMKGGQATTKKKKTPKQPSGLLNTQKEDPIIWKSWRLFLEASTNGYCYKQNTSLAGSLALPKLTVGMSLHDHTELTATTEVTTLCLTSWWPPPENPWLILKICVSPSSSCLLPSVLPVVVLDSKAAEQAPARSAVAVSLPWAWQQSQHRGRYSLMQLTCTWPAAGHGDVI